MEALLKNEEHTRLLVEESPDKTGMEVEQRHVILTRLACNYLARSDQNRCRADPVPFLRRGRHSPAGSVVYNRGSKMIENTPCDLFLLLPH